MTRSTIFRTVAEPLRDSPLLRLSPTSPRGVFSFLNPTRAIFSHEPSSAASPTSTHSPPPPPPPAEDEAACPRPPPPLDLHYKWLSRDNRKGRHTLLLPPSLTAAAYAAAGGADASDGVPASSYSWRHVRHTLRLCATSFPLHSISYDVAALFTIGSVIWVVNGFFAYLPLAQPATEFSGEIAYGGGWTAFVGATIFEVGSVLLMIEAVNANREGCFGWAVARLVHGEGVADEEEGKGGSSEGWNVKPAPEECSHHQANPKNFVGSGPAGGADEHSSEEDLPAKSSEKKSWQWYPSWHDLTTHYIFELGFLACAAQLFGATIFWISGFTALPYILERLDTQKSLDGAYWVPQIIGGSGFIVSGALFMLETQEKWWKPSFASLGWHIAGWNLVGAFGFTLCGALGPAYGNSGAQYQASLATFWGSWAFLIGSVIQLYESLDTHPVKKMTPAEAKAMGISN